MDLIHDMLTKRVIANNNTTEGVGGDLGADVWNSRGDVKFVRFFNDLQLP